MKTTFTKSDLRHNVSNGTDSHFFDSKSMRFFGDTMANYGLRSATVKVNEQYSNGLILPTSTEVWELYRKNPVKHGLKDSAYFDKKTFSRVFPAKY